MLCSVLLIYLSDTLLGGDDTGTDTTETPTSCEDLAPWCEIAKQDGNCDDVKERCMATCGFCRCPPITLYIHTFSMLFTIRFKTTNLLLY